MKRLKGLVLICILFCSIGCQDKNLVMVPIEKNSKKNDNFDDYIQKYKLILTDEKYKDSYYTFIDLDNDCSDELVIIQGESHHSNCDIFRLGESSEDEIIKIQHEGLDFCQYGCVLYNDETSRLFDHYDTFSDQFVINYITVYKLELDHVEEIVLLKTICDVESMEFKYFINDKEVTKEEYDSCYRINIANEKSIKYYDCYKISDLLK